MQFHLRYLSVFLLVWAVVLGQGSWAQDESSLTPRERFIGFIQDGNWPEVESVIPEVDVEIVPVTVPDITFDGPLPFYLGAAEYLKARQDSEGPVIFARYDVQAENIQTGNAWEPRTVELQIGPDYVAFTQGNARRIYDFKTERLLNISTAGNDTSPIFDIQSLYARALKSVSLVNKNTERGQIGSIDLGEGKSLDAFWLESNSGWTARDVSNDILIKQTETSFNAIYDEQTVVGMDLDGPEWPSREHLNAVHTFWHHELPIHPQILADMAPLPTLPGRVTSLSYSPTTLDGVKTTWTLSESEIRDAEFPLDAEALNMADTPEISMIAFVTAQAGRGIAQDGRPSDDDLRDRIAQKADDTDILGAWIDAKYLEQRLGGCGNDPALLCDDIAALEDKASHENGLKLLLSARAAKDGETRLGHLIELIEFMKTGNPKPYVTKTAGILRSKLKSDMDERLVSLPAGSFLERSLIEYPYDPETLHSLSQVYAAQGRYMESWNLLDILRILPDTPAAFTTPVERVEKSLKSRAPGYFLP